MGPALHRCPSYLSGQSLILAALGPESLSPRVVISICSGQGHVLITQAQQRESWACCRGPFSQRGILTANQQHLSGTFQVMRPHGGRPREPAPRQGGHGRGS